MNKNLNFSKQKGFSMWSFLFVGGVFIFCLYVGAKLVPVYTADSAIQKAFNNSLEGLSNDQLRKKSIAKDVEQRIYIDGIYNGPVIQDSLEIKKTKKGTELTIAYKEQVPLFFNIGMYLDFSHVIEK